MEAMVNAVPVYTLWKGNKRVGNFATAEKAKGAGYKVLLRNNETGEERFVEHPIPWEEHHDYMWVDGNYGCDCNRHLFFERANGVEPEDAQCGDEKYSALYALLPDGTRHELDEAPNV